MQKVIAFANQKGGVGKTTSAVNISAYVAEANYNVLLVDIDPQGNASSGLGIETNSLQKTIYGVLLGKISCSEAIVPTNYNNLHILPANVNLSGIEIDMLQMENREFMLKNALEQVKSRFDYIFIDCPPNLGILTINALCAARQTIIILQTEYYALEGLSQLMKIIHLMQKSLNPELLLDGIILTMFDIRTALAQHVVSDIKEHFKDKVYLNIVPRSVRLSEAPSYGKYIGDYAPDSTGAEAYKKLSVEIIARK